MVRQPERLQFQSDKKRARFRSMHFARIQLKNWRNFVSVDLKLGERLFITRPNAGGGLG
jgi:hypothetical protein